MPSTNTLLLLLALIALLWYAALSVVTFAAFAVDKMLARNQARRISERTLHTLSALGGFPGAMLAMRLVRHKSSKPPFILTTLALAAAHAALWIVLIILLVWLR